MSDEKKTITQNNLPNLWDRIQAFINSRLPKGALAAKDTAPIEMGGTDATNAKDARVNLGITYGTEVPIETPETGSGTIYFFEDDHTPVAIEEGGTGANNIEDARQTLNFLGENPITSIAEDTPANWAALGTGIAYIGENVLNNQPTPYCVVENRVYFGTHGNGLLISQTLYAMGSTTSGETYTRTGNANGWYENTANWVQNVDIPMITKIFGSEQYTATATASENYSSVSATVTRVGQIIRIYFTATRTAASGTGNITNEIICTITFDHKNELIDLYVISSNNGSTGPLSSIQADDISINSDGTATVSIRLTAVDTALSSINSYIALPARLNLSAFC